MTHVDRDTLAVLALDGDESGAREERSHLASCPECQRVFEEYRRTVAVARSLTPEEREVTAPPPRVWAALAAELDGGLDGGVDGDDRPTTVVPLLRERRERSLAPGAWLAAAAAVAALAVVAAMLVVRDPGPALVADTTLEPLADVGPATARLLEGPEGLTLEVTTEGLPEPEGYYELWLIDTDVSRLISLGPLARGGRYDLPAGLDVAGFPVVDVSLESFDGDPSHSGNSVLRGVLPLDGEG